MLRNYQFYSGDATDLPLFETSSKLMRNSLERSAGSQNRWYIALRTLKFTQSKHCTRIKSQFCRTQNRCTKIWTKINHFWTLRTRMRLDLLHQRHFHLVVDTIPCHRNFRTNEQFFGQKVLHGEQGDNCTKNTKTGIHKWTLRKIAQADWLHFGYNFTMSTACQNKVFVLESPEQISTCHNSANSLIFRAKNVQSCNTFGKKKRKHWKF